MANAVSRVQRRYRSETDADFSPEARADRCLTTGRFDGLDERLVLPRVHRLRSVTSPSGTVSLGTSKKDRCTPLRAVASRSDARGGDREMGRVDGLRQPITLLRRLPVSMVSTPSAVSGWWPMDVGARFWGVSN